MSRDVESVEDDFDVRKVWYGLPAAESSRVHLKDLDPKEADLIERTRKQLPNISSAMPHSLDEPLLGRMTVGPTGPNAPVGALEAQNKRLEGTVADLERMKDKLPEGKQVPFPNLAWEAVKAGLAKENLTNEQINRHVEEIEKHQNDVDLLLDFSTELSNLKDGKVTDDLKTLASKLKERGIDLWKSDEKTLSKDRISELKSLSGSHIEKRRSQIQISFTTKVQPLVQAISAIMEALKDIIANNRRVISKANDNMSKH